MRQCIDQPAGCDACWLWENGNCAKEALYEKMKEESENQENKEIVIRVTENFYQKIMEMDADKTASFNETALVEAVQKGEVLNKDATRKKGQWTPGDPICPCCGEDKFKDLDADIWSDWRPKYCPNCGAKMKSGE